MKTLTDRAYAHALELIRRRNTPSEDHQTLLRATVETLVQCVRGHLGDRRVAISIPTGGGKSTAIRALIRALHEDENSDEGVLVLAEQIRAGRELLDQLLHEDGISSTAVAHVHSRGGGAVPEDAAFYRFVIATHERSKMEGVRRLLDYGGRRRGILIDEGLHASSAFGVKEDDVQLGLDGAVKHAAKAGDEDLANWAEQAAQQLQNAKSSLQVDGVCSVPVRIPTPDWEIEPSIRRLKNHDDTHVARRILEASNVNSEFTLTSRAVLQHRRVLPEGLDEGVVILDAGYQIDALQRLDDGLVDAERLAWWPRGLKASKLKDWSDVHLHHMRAPGGASKQIEDSTRRKLYAKKAAELILAHAHDGDEVLVCCYMRVERSQQEEIIHVLRGKLGDNLETSDERREHGDSVWVRFIHWGMHHSTNRYQEARIVVALGDFPISDMDARAMARGQQAVAGEATELTSQQVKGVLDSWCATKLLQLAGRGRSRQAIEGRARSMLFAFITGRPSTVEHLQQAMPGAVLTQWATPLEILAVDEGRKEKLRLANEQRSQDSQTVVVAMRVFEVLDDLHSDQVSTRSLRKLCGFPTSGKKKVSSDVFSEGVTRAITGTLWVREGQSVFREEPEMSIEEMFGDEMGTRAFS